MFLRRGSLQSPLELQPLEERSISRLGSDLAGCTSAVASLAGSFVYLSHMDGEASWQFRHPTIGDAYAGILADNPEHLAIFVAGSEPSKLIAQITCGDVGIERATIVPRSLFREVMGKLDELDEVAQRHPDDLTRYAATRGLLAFLARRCSDEFLRLYLDRHPELLNRISEPGMSLAYVSEVPLALRLHELALLPEVHRKRFLDTVSTYLLNAWDAGALSNPRIRNLYQRDEFDGLIQSVRDEILSDLDGIRDREESDWDEDVPPDDWMQQLKDFLNALESYFKDEQEIVDRIDDQLSSIESWIRGHIDCEYEGDERLIGRVELPVAPTGGRSIFDDIDAE